MPKVRSTKVRRRWLKLLSFHLLCLLGLISHKMKRKGSSNPKKTMHETEQFISLFHVIPFSKALHVYGKEKAFLNSAGRKIENFDMSIGATALKHNMVMVTDNVEHLGRIRGIEIENWKLNEPII